ncbi:Membrane protein involved in aromatic hydrocarbon degradation [Candidatus Magnetomorum sp. HK-1]|nr:Membrane protein involved in aromatic hydrocarbon degradation [Candidatus Magnetomorum sp. HK-1]
MSTMNGFNHFYRSCIFLWCLIITSQMPANADYFSATSTYNPVVSGARTLGLGGAFISIANDGTATTVNPAGLYQLKHPEFSFVVSNTRRSETNDFGEATITSGVQSVNNSQLNYLSVVTPLRLFNKSIRFAISYQHLYDFSREWRFTHHTKIRDKNMNITGVEPVTYQQKGSLSAVGIALSFEIIQRYLYGGITFNIWDNDLTSNHWVEKAQSVLTEYFSDNNNPPQPFLRTFTNKENQTFKGYNFNIGFLWRMTKNISLGGVLKTPFKADIEYHQFTRLNNVPSFKLENNQLKMPMSYGFGLKYHPDKTNVFFSMDIYKTCWDHFIYITENGETKYAITDIDTAISNTPSTYQIRFGTEYRIKNDLKKYILSFRGGLFSDPSPAENKVDEFYGASCGIGFSYNFIFSCDLAYQYRMGNNVGEYFINRDDYSHDVSEHMVYLSFIYYFSKNKSDH